MAQRNLSTNKDRWISGFQAAYPGWHLRRLRSDYLYEDHRRECGVQFGLGIEKHQLCGRFLLFPSLAGSLALVGSDLQKAVGTEHDLTIRGDRHTVIFRHTHDLEDEQTWPAGWDWANRVLKELQAFFNRHRLAFRQRTYP